MLILEDMMGEEKIVGSSDDRNWSITCQDDVAMCLYNRDARLDIS